MSVLDSRLKRKGTAKGAKGAAKGTAAAGRGLVRAANRRRHGEPTIPSRVKLAVAGALAAIGAAGVYALASRNMRRRRLAEPVQSQTTSVNGEQPASAPAHVPA